MATPDPARSSSVEPDVPACWLDEFESEIPAAAPSITVVPAAAVPLASPPAVLKPPADRRRSRLVSIAVPVVFVPMLGVALAAVRYAATEPVVSTPRMPPSRAVGRGPQPAAAREVPAPFDESAPAASAGVSEAEPVPLRSSPDRARILETLEIYRRGYSARDAALVASAWPRADTPALARAFSALRYQGLAFERCDLQTDGSDRALAWCDAAISYVQKEGEPELLRRRERLTFSLQLDGGEWRIADVVSGRPA